MQERKYIDLLFETLLNLLNKIVSKYIGVQGIVQNSDDLKPQPFWLAVNNGSVFVFLFGFFVFFYSIVKQLHLIMFRNDLCSALNSLST